MTQEISKTDKEGGEGGEWRTLKPRRGGRGVNCQAHLLGD